jgi:general stress protein 26
LEIIKSGGYCFMASSVNNQPGVRPMKFVVTEDFKFWCSTVDISGKVEEFKNNSKVELCWLDKNYNQLRVEGLVDVSGGADKIKKLLELHSEAKSLFKDENDPELVHVEVIPAYIRWKDSSFSEYNVVKQVIPQVKKWTFWESCQGPWIYVLYL